MIDKDSLFSIQWTDSFIYSMNIQKNENSLDLKLIIDSISLLEIFFHDCYAIFSSNYGYFLGKETIRDVDFVNSSELISSENSKLLDKSIILNEIRISLNSGGIISCLITNSTTFFSEEKEYEKL